MSSILPALRRVTGICSIPGNICCVLKNETPGKAIRMPAGHLSYTVKERTVDGSRAVFFKVIKKERALGILVKGMQYSESIHRSQEGGEKF